jgi:hypothetical protein
MSRTRLTSMIRAVAAASLLVLGAHTRAAAESSASRASCVPIGGMLMTRLGAINETTTLGTVVGDLRGVVSAAILEQTQLADGAIRLSVQHFWITEAGDFLFLEKGSVTITPVSPGVYGALYDPVPIKGGTGRLNGASGVVTFFGAADLSLGQIVLRYGGHICGHKGSAP